MMDAVKRCARLVGLTEVIRTIRRWRKGRRLQRMRETPITHEHLTADLEALGIKAGDAVMVHSSLSALGFVVGGPDAVADALLAVLGPEGTLLVPTYPVTDWTLENLRNLPVLEFGSPSTMGALTNCLLRRKGAFRSFHPTHSWSGLGPMAPYLLQDHHKSVTPCGPGSPFERLLEVDGCVAILGSPWSKCTFWHVIEDRVDFPLDVYYPDQFFGRVRFPNGELVQVPFRVHDPLLAATRLETDEDHSALLLSRFRRYGLVQEGRVGFGTGYFLRARDFLEGQKLLLQEGITIYKGQPRSPGPRSRVSH